jgi:hypothetical protein
MAVCLVVDFSASRQVFGFYDQKCERYETHICLASHQVKRSMTMDMTEKMGATIPQEIWHIVQQFASDTKQLLQEELMAEYLFGSYATNTQTPASDIDILVIVKHFSPELQRKISGLASDYSLEYDMYISPIIQGNETWEQNKTHKTLFYQNVIQQGISL